MVSDCLTLPRGFQSRVRKPALDAPIFVFAAALFFCWTLNAASGTAKVYAQQQSAPDSKTTDDDVLRIRTDLMVVPAFVTDRRNRRVQGLKQSDFVVLDDGRPVNVQYFASGTDRVALLFALDASGSAREIARRERETALALFSRFGAGSRVAVLRFTSSAALTAQFTDHGDQILAAFEMPALAGEHTAIFDAAATAIRAFDTNGRGPAERRIIILISDGLDTASTIKPADVINQARARAVSIYAVQLPIFSPEGGRLVARRPSKGFREMAEQTGGQFFVVGDARSALDPRAQIDLAPVFRAIADDLASQYVFGYYPAPEERDARAHHIDIRIAGPESGPLRVRQLRESYILKP